MTLGSFFDGIGGWLGAAKHAGVSPLWASEIEPFPCEVTAHHFPEVQQLGDITKLRAEDIPPVDIVCAGSPCQDLSTAGKRGGLDGERSGLFRTAIRLVHSMRERTGKPRFFVWENVMGAFTSNKGNDFRAVLEEIGRAEIPLPPHGRWTRGGLVDLPQCQIAWRVLDAQYFGVPQRRKRIFLIADFGATGRCAGEILFERESVQGNTCAGGATRQAATDGAKDSTRAAEQYAVGERMGDRIQMNATKSVTLSALGGGGAAKNGLYCLPTWTMGHDEREAGFQLGIADTVTRSDYKQPQICNQGYIVRRLTPTECERLQGLPDGYTLIDSKRCSDTARYKALGNGMAQPCADYVIKRIVEVVGDGIY